MKRRLFVCLATLLAFAVDRFEAIGEAMRRELAARGVTGRVCVLQPDYEGLQVL